MIAMNTTDAGRKKARVLHLAGEDVYDLYQSIAVVDTEEDEYKSAIETLKRHFTPVENVEYQIHLFRQA